MGGYIRQQVNILNFEVDVLEAEKMGQRKDVSDFDKGQIVLARRLGQNISRTAALVGCSRSAVVRTDQKWSKEGTGEPTGSDPRLIDARGERRLARVVRSNRRATGAQTAEKVNAGSDRKVSEHTEHLSLLRMGTGQGARADPCPPPKAPTMGT